MRTILVIEDDQLIRETLSEVIEYEGFAVATAAHGGEGLSWLQDHAQQACAVLLDLMMPVMDGFEFLRLKDSNPSLASVPVVVITAAGPIVEASLRKKHRVQECLSKPLHMGRLLTAIHGCCAADPPS